MRLCRAEFRDSHRHWAFAMMRRISELRAAAVARLQRAEIPGTCTEGAPLGAATLG